VTESRKLIADHSLAAGLCSNAQVASFVFQYLIDHDAEAAAERIGLDRKIGSALIRRGQVQRAIKVEASRRPQQAERAKQLLDQFWDISTADLREIQAPILANCRYCWGENFQYQSTVNEFRQAKKRHEDKVEWARKANKEYNEPFDLQGGDGFDPLRDPNPDCIECFGKGVLAIKTKDSREWSPQAVALYDGIEQTQYGPKIKIRNRDPVDRILADNLGILKQRTLIQLERAMENPEKLSDEELYRMLEMLGVSREQAIIDITPAKSDNKG
jgi:phage terminase small subunit